MLPEAPIVSIVTPVFNRAVLVQKTIDSVVAQTYQNWELLLVDDGSTDNIAEIVQSRYAKETRISFTRRSREPKSASTCRNIGVEKAMGHYLIFLDSDDWLQPFCIEQRVKVMVGNPDLDFAVFPFTFIDHEGTVTQKQFDNGRHPLINFLSNKSYWAIMSPIWKRQFFVTIGGFNERFSRYQDPEIHIRALTHPDVKYRLCSDHQPDAVVTPNYRKKDPKFALDMLLSLSLLVPQTYESLEKGGKTESIGYMDGYLRESLALFASSNFDDRIAKELKEVLLVCRRYGVLSDFRMKLYRAELLLAAFLVKLLKHACTKFLWNWR